MASFTTNENLYKWSPTDTKTETITEMAKNADKIDAKFVEVDASLSEKATNVRVEATEVRITETETDIATLETSKADNLVVTAALAEKAKQTDLNTTNTNVSSNTSEIVGARQSATKNKTFSVIDGRFEELEEDTYFAAKNEVANGDFSLDANADSIPDGYSTLGAIGTKTLTNNKLSLIKNDTSNFWGLNYTKTTGLKNLIAGHKYYFSVNAGISGAATGVTFLRSRLAFGTAVFSDGPDVTFTTNIGVNVRRSVVKTVTTSGDADWYITAHTTNNADSVGTTFEISYIIAFDLTAIFEAGNEPTAIEIDTILSQFPNSWFDGVKQIGNVRQLMIRTMNELRKKATATQESWLTPSLLNAWVSFDATTTPKYRKDNFGMIRLEGRVKSGAIGTVVLTLPVGYRPLSSKYHAVASNNAYGQVLVDTNGNITVNVGSNVWVSLNGITFSID